MSLHDNPTRSGDGAPSRRRLVGLFLLAAVELAAAYVVARGLIALGRSLDDSTGAGHTDATGAGHGAHDLDSVPAPPSHHRDLIDAATMSPATQAPSTMSWVFLAAMCVVGFVLWFIRRRLDSAVLVGGGVLIAACALLPVVRSAVAASHLGMMTQLMTLMVIAPALIAFGLRSAQQAPVRVIRWTAIPAALAYAVVMLVWHAPNLDIGMSPSLGAALLPFVVGLALWLSMALDQRPAVQRLRKVTLYVAGIPAGLIGLALIISNVPIVAGHHNGALWLGPVTDQRLGGLLMMVVEAVFFTPILMEANLFTRLAERSVRQAPPVRAD